MILNSLMTIYSIIKFLIKIKMKLLDLIFKLEVLMTQLSHLQIFNNLLKLNLLLIFQTHFLWEWDNSLNRLEISYRLVIIFHYWVKFLIRTIKKKTKKRIMEKENWIFCLPNAIYILFIKLLYLDKLGFLKMYLL